MEDSGKALLQRQVDAELKNALKSEERKKKQKRKLDSTKDNKSEPPKKKEKKSTIIPITVRDIEAIRQKFYTVPVYLPLIGKVALFSGVSNETLAFAAYPIILGPLTKQDGKYIAKDYILGVSRIPYIFTILRGLFEELYPEKSAMDCCNWEVYRLNRAYYTVKPEKASYNQDLLELQLAETKPLGGPKDTPSVHWLEENKLKRWEKAITLETYFKDKDIRKIKGGKIPADAKSFPSDYLNTINEKVEELKKDLLLSQDKAKNELGKKEIAEAMKNLKDDASDSDSDESD